MESLEPAPELSLLQRIRNAWEFSNLMQFIFTFGKAVKIDEDFSIEVRTLETAHALSSHHKRISLHYMIHCRVFADGNRIRSLKPNALKWGHQRN